MPILECSVKTCTHNADNKCCLDCIKIEGRSANTTDGTLCSSFSLRKEGATNKTETVPSSTCKIMCEAVKCEYNEECVCHAKGIDVCGRNACVSGETECSTFKCK